MNLIHYYRNNFRYWKDLKKFPKVIQHTGRWPSETCHKYPISYNFNNQKVLNYGCGKTIYKSPNVINADIVPGDGIKVIDPSKPLTQLGMDFDFIIANHVLEHVPDWFEKLKELASMLKVGGRIEIWIPPISSDSAFSYRDHINRIGEQSFAGCASMPFPGTNALAEVTFKEIGDVVKLYCVQYSYRPLIKWWTMLAWPSLLQWMSNHLRNVITEEQFIFVKLP